MTIGDASRDCIFMKQPYPDRITEKLFDARKHEPEVTSSRRAQHSHVVFVHLIIRRWKECWCRKNGLF